jgi:hypothetical protein
MRRCLGEDCKREEERSYPFVCEKCQGTEAWRFGDQFSAHEASLDSQAG